MKAGSWEHERANGIGGRPATGDSRTGCLTPSRLTSTAIGRATAEVVSPGSRPTRASGQASRRGARCAGRRGRARGDRSRPSEARAVPSLATRRAAARAVRRIPTTLTSHCDTSVCSEPSGGFPSWSPALLARPGTPRPPGRGRPSPCGRRPCRSRAVGDPAELSAPGGLPGRPPSAVRRPTRAAGALGLATPGLATRRLPVPPVR